MARVARLVHLARASTERAIRRAGIHGRKLLIPVASEKEPRILERGVFAMPVLRDFGVTYQWLRELRQWHGERMIAVHVRIPDDEVVLVGRYGQPHAEQRVTVASKAIVAKPAGAEIIVPRAIAKSEVVAIREMTQLVGWTDVPEADRKFDCICPACLPRGVPDRIRKINGAYRRGFDAYRRATTDRERLDALSRIGTVLGEAPEKLDGAPLLRIARSRSASSDVRRRAVALLGDLPWSRTGEALTAHALSDTDPTVRARAVTAILRAAGPLRAERVLRAAAERENELLLHDLAEEIPTRQVVEALGRVVARYPDTLARSAGFAARKLLADDVEDTQTRGLLEVLAKGLKRMES